MFLNLDLSPLTSTGLNGQLDYRNTLWYTIFQSVFSQLIVKYALERGGKTKKKCVSLYAKIVVYGIHRLGGVACWPFFACHAPLPKFIYWNPGDDNLSSATTAKTSPASDVKLNKNVKLKSLFKLSALKKTFKENKKRKMKQVKTETDILLLHNKWFNEVKTENIYHSPENLTPF